MSNVGDLGGTASGGFYLAASDYVRIEATVLTGLKAVKYDNLIPTGNVYNLGLNNSSKSAYWLGAVPNDIIAYLNKEANNLEATKNSVILATGNLIHPTEITDPGNNYDPVTGRYTCPNGAIVTGKQIGRAHV